MAVIYNLIETIFPFEWLSPNFMKNAFLAIIAAAPLFGLLGNFVVSNHLAFYSDAIGHSALTGVAIGVLLGFRDPTGAMIAFSIILGAAIIAVKNTGGESGDTIIGVFSSTAVAAGIVILSSQSNFNRYQKYLVGDILSVMPKDIVLLFAALVIVFAVWILFYNKMLLVNLHRGFAKSRGIKINTIEIMFSLLTAAIVALAIQWTGLLVINSLLVLPSASSRLVSRSVQKSFLLSVLFSLASGITGLALSYYAGAASGASIVLVNAIIFAVCFIIRFLTSRVHVRHAPL